MFKTKEATYISPLTPGELNARLQSVTEKYFSPPIFPLFQGKRHDYKFEGKILNDGFKIYPTFFWRSHREIILYPEIAGKYFPKGYQTEIKLRFSMPKEIKTLLTFVLIPNVILIILMIFFPILTDFPFYGKWWVYLLFLVFTFLMFEIRFQYKIYKVEKLLIGLLELEKENIQFQ